jgi:hypothetical protein
MFVNKENEGKKSERWMEFNVDGFQIMVRPGNPSKSLEATWKRTEACGTSVMSLEVPAGQWGSLGANGIYQRASYWAVSEYLSVTVGYSEEAK